MNAKATGNVSARDDPRRCGCKDPAADETIASTEALRGYARVWKQKPVLRLIYDDFYRRLAAETSPGLTIEIGGGIGNLKGRLSQVVATDIQFATWLDCVADAQHLPFLADCASNIIMVDVLHHIEFPAVFFREAERVLRPGGRIIMIEPAITGGSTLFYRLFHNEPVRSSADILTEGSASTGRDPYASNQAIPTILVTRDWERFHAQFPHLAIKRVDWFSFVSYPLSGGFRRWALIGSGLGRHLLRIERAIEPFLGRAMAFRMMIAIEKYPTRRPQSTGESDGRDSRA
jgi:SAM-dependent methyltransferase